MTNLDSILKSRDITLPKKDKAMCLFVCLFVSVIIYGCENWAIKKAEC